MKVAALSPQFVYEVPTSAEEADQKKIARDLHLKLVRPEESATTGDATSGHERNPREEASGEVGEEKKTSLDDETKEGLKRLSQLLRDKRDRSKNEDAVLSILHARDRQKRRAFSIYKAIAEAQDPRAGKGEILDDFY